MAEKAPSSTPVLRPPETRSLKQDTVHVWAAFLDRRLPAVRRLRSLLAADERARAARFRFAEDRRRFVVARGLLRLLLASYTHETPSALRFAYEAYGKPVLAGADGASALRFNVSHSEDLALFAVARGRDVGVDVEHVRPDRADEGITRQVFATTEQAALQQLPEAAWHETFFTYWTRKEAYIKATGKGLQLPLKQFSVSWPAGQRAGVVDDSHGERWRVRDVNAGEGCAGALAAAGLGWQLQRHQAPGFQAAAGAGER